MSTMLYCINSDLNRTEAEAKNVHCCSPPTLLRQRDLVVWRLLIAVLSAIRFRWRCVWRRKDENNRRANSAEGSHCTHSYARVTRCIVCGA
jgi:hypothetical protein